MIPKIGILETSNSTSDFIYISCLRLINMDSLASLSIYEIGLISNFPVLLAREAVNIKTIECLSNYCLLVALSLPLIINLLLLHTFYFLLTT